MLFTNDLSEYYSKSHRYFVFASGLKNFKEKYFLTRREAEAYMHKICKEQNIKIECTECDKHERKYSDHNGTRFYINRI